MRFDRRAAGAQLHKDGILESVEQGAAVCGNGTDFVPAEMRI